MLALLNTLDFPHAARLSDAQIVEAGPIRYDVLQFLFARYSHKSDYSKTTNIF